MAITNVTGATTSKAAVVLTPNFRQLMVSKEINGELWLMTREINDSTVTANVVKADGSTARP